MSESTQSAVEDAAMSRVWTQEVEFGSVAIVESGTGSPLLYLHGVGDAGALIPSIASFARTRRVIRPDHPGFIRSSSGGFSSVADIARWYAGQLDECSLDAIDLVGCSLGGWIAAELALLRPDRFSSITFIDPAGLPDLDDPRSVFEMHASESLRRTFATEKFRAFAANNPPDAEASAWLRRSAAEAERIAGDPYMHDPSLASRLRTLGIPSYLVWGERDGIIPVAVAEQWRRALPDVRYGAIPDAGHLPHLEQPERFLAFAEHLER